MPFMVDTRGEHWTYGAEHELADWDTYKAMPAGLYRTKDHTIVNTNGVAAQPNIKVYRYGGEINTPSTHSITGQVKLLEVIRNEYTVKVNHRSNLHLHIRVPGLKDSLAMLKRVQQYIHAELPKVMDQLEPIPQGTTSAEKKRERRRRVSHHTFLTSARVHNQLQARTAQKFFELEVPWSKSGKVMWHAQPRCCVNLRQLLQTDTVEFRHFPGTLSAGQLDRCFQWCQEFLLAAMSETSIDELWGRYCGNPFPDFPSFDEEREIRYQATAAKNGYTLAQVKQNIRYIQEGRFNAKDQPVEYAKALQLARGMPRKHLP